MPIRVWKLDNIGDVIVESPSNRDFLQFNGTSEKWEKFVPAYFSLRSTADSSALPASATTVIFDTDLAAHTNDFTVGFTYTGTTGNIDVTAAGIYLVNTSSALAAAVSTDITYALRVNGAAVVSLEAGASAVATWSPTISRVLSLAAGDDITVAVTTGAASNYIVQTGTNITIVRLA